VAAERVGAETLLAMLDWLEWPVAIYDAEDRLAYFNKAYAALRSAIGGTVALGVRWDDLVAASVRAGSIPEARGQEEEWLAKRRQERGRYDVVRQIPDGRWFQVRERRLPDAGVIAIWYDVSKLVHATREAERELVDRRRAEASLATINQELEERVAARTQALEDKERFLSAVIENIGDAIFVHRDDAIVFANRACLGLFGATSADQVVGASPLRFFPERWRAAVAQRLRQVMTGMDQNGPAEKQVLRLDGTLVEVETQSVSYQDEGSRTIISIVRDITRRKDAEQQLRQAQRMDAIGQLTGGVAHDFNNILTVIMGTAELLADAVTDQPKLLTYARTIEAAATRGADMTRKLLAYARKQPLQPMSTDVNGLVAEAVKFLRPTLGEHIELESILLDDVWPALVDAAQLSTALLNLAVNARDAMPDGGKLMLQTANVVLDAAYAAAHTEVVPGPYVMIAVSDTGAGMSPAVVARAFEPFFTTKDVGRGTGLGLSMVFGFVKQSGGHIKIYSEERVGTSIKMYLPRSTDGAPSEAP